MEAEAERSGGGVLELGLYISRRRGTCEVVVNPSLRVEPDGPDSWAAQPMCFYCMFDPDTFDSQIS